MGLQFREVVVLVRHDHIKKKINKIIIIIIKLLKEAGRCPPGAVPGWCHLFPCHMSYFWQRQLSVLVMLWKVRYFLCCHLLLRIMSFLVVYYGALLQCRSNFRWVLVTGPCDVIW